MPHVELFNYISTIDEKSRKYFNNIIEILKIK